MSSPRALASEPAALPLLADFFQRLHSADVPYCHWKSNEHLDEAVRGATDLDVLVDPQMALPLARVLSDVGFKRCAAVPDAAYAGVEDYLALDQTSGRLVHLHLHYQLTVGEKFLKSYRLPWEHVVLATRRLDQATGVFVADPHIELLLLVVRAALKIRRRDRVRPRPGLRGGALREFHWLQARIDPDRLHALASALVGAVAAARLRDMLERPPTVRGLVVFRHSVRPRLDHYRTFGAMGAQRRRWAREWRGWRRRALRRHGWLTPSRRVLPRGGRLIALVGSDGSGKSTLLRAITQWLAWKLDVEAMYFGRGDGPVSPLRLPLQLFRAFRRRGQPRTVAHPAAVPRGAPDAARRPRSVLKRLLRRWRDLTVCLEKRARLTRAHRARNLGMIVICDRYPQAQIHGFTDGPLLSEWRTSTSRWRRALAAWELATYRLADVMAPDLVIKLHVSPHVAVQRKPDAAQQPLVRRIEAIRDLAYPPQTRVVDIDADQPLDEVVRRVKAAVWECL